MEKLASRVTSYPQGEVKIYVKAKNASPALAKEIKCNPVALEKKESESSNKLADKPLSVLPENKPARHFLDAVSKYEFKKVFQTPFPRKSSTNWGSPRNPFLHRKESKMGKNLVPFVFSVCGAVLVGVVMGLSILSLFFSNHTNQSSSSIDSHLPNTKVERGNLVSLPPLRVVVLQAGSFFEQEGAQKAVDEFRARGMSAVMSSVAPFRVFLGLATSDEEAEKLATVYKKNKVEVYQKEISLVDKVVLTNDQQKLESVIRKGNYLVVELSKLSSRGIVTGLSGPRDSKISQYYQEFYRGSQAVLPSLSTEGKEKLTEMRKALDQAIQSANSIQGNSSQTVMWKVQEGLVRYVTAYEKLIRILSKA